LKKRRNKLGNNEIIVGCDLGSYKIVGIAGVKEEDKIKVLGFGEAESTGIEKGTVTNIEKVSRAIEVALEKALKMAEKEKREIIVSISGENTEGKIEKGFAIIQTPDNEIRKEDVKKVIEQAKTRSYSEEKEIIFVYPNHFIVDDQKGIKEPIGMIGTKLEVEAFILKAKRNILRTIEKCFKKAGFEVSGFISQPISSSFGVLDEEEKSQGVAVIDIGKGTTDIAIWKDCGLYYTSTLKIGGDFLINDLATCLKIPKLKASEILKKYNFVGKKLAEDKEKLIVERTGGRPPVEVDPKEYAQIVEERLTEIFGFCLMEIRKWDDPQNLVAGIVLTGGYAEIEGIEDVAEKVFNLNVIKKGPQNVSGLHEVVKHPAYSASVGLLKIAIMEEEKRKIKKKSIFKKIFDFLEKI
jgi:cell division protein FtsA